MIPVKILPATPVGVRRRRIGTRLSPWGSVAAATGRAVEDIDYAAQAKRKEDPRPVLELPLTQYQSDPVAFAREILGIEHLTEKQEEILRAYVTHREVSVSSANGIGKSFLLPIIAWHNFACWPDVYVGFGSSVDRQIRISLWLPFRQIWRAAPYRIGAPPRVSHILGHASDDDRRIVMGSAPKTKSNVMGTRRKRTIVLLDESPGIIDEVNDGYENLITGEDSVKVNMGNPISSGGWFRAKFKKQEDQAPVDINSAIFELSAFDSPNVVAGREVVPGLVGRAWVEERRRKWGEDDPRYIIHVLGRFLENDETRIFPDAMIGMMWDPAARANPAAILQVGIDLAEYGGDRTLAYFRRGATITHRLDLTGMDFEAVSAAVIEAIAADNPEEVAHVYYDKTGIGQKFERAWGSSRHKLFGIVYGQRAKERDVYHSARDEMPWHLKDWFRHGGKIALPPKREDQGMLKKEMENAFFSYDLSRRIVSNEKDRIRKSLGRSCDDYDAICLATYDWQSTRHLTARRATKIVTEAKPLKPNPFSQTGFRYPR